MKFFSNSRRLLKINLILARYDLGHLIFAGPFFSSIKFLRYLNPLTWRKRNPLSRGVRIRLCFEELGPIFIKVGQILSTRLDIFPVDITCELAKLQDRVPPFSGVLAQKIVEDALGGPLTQFFSAFAEVPLASASISQVHAATLLDGKDVVVKVLRPGIREIINQDLDLLFVLARLADKYWPEGRQFKPLEIVDEIARTLRDELDLMREGANASQLRRNFNYSPMLYVPEIYWNFCRENILVMERIYGVPIYDIETLRTSGVNLKNLAERCVEIFFTQVFRDSFFHADMHPGNIFVSLKNLELPQYIAVDFGIMGSLNTKDQRYLAENLLAFFKRDYQRVAELHVASGWLAPNARIDQFEGAIRAVCEPIFERPLKDISFGQLLLRLFQTAREFNLNIQPQLILLQKTLLNVEGIGRQLYPDLDLWSTAAPFLEKWLKRQVGGRAFFRRIRENLPFWSEKLPELPILIHDVLANQLDKQEYSRHAQAQHAAHKNHQKVGRKRQLLLGLSLGFALSAVMLISALSYPKILMILFSLAVITLALR